MSKFPEYKHTKSHEYFDRAIKVIPSGIYGHLGPAEGLWVPVSKWPFYSEKAKGTYFWDVDGNKYIDYMCAYGPNVLGYNDPDVDAAAMKQMKLGNCTTSPSKVMVECAENLVNTVASADWAFFAKNGSDVTTLAVMTARAHTHKKKMFFLKGYYHGDFQWGSEDRLPPAFFPKRLQTTLLFRGSIFRLLRTLTTLATATLQAHSSAVRSRQLLRQPLCLQGVLAGCS